jgi:hypothetical protein
VTKGIGLLGAIAIAIAGSGCGSDDSGQETAPAVSIPAITSPLETATTTPGTTTTPDTTPKPGKGGKTYNPKLPDSETNDVPPPAGSPQEAFEKQCEQNPEACG